MTRRPSDRPKKVPIKFNDMIHELSNKNQRSIDENDDETVNQKENIDSNESNSVDNGGEIEYKVDMENDTSGNRFGGDYGVGAQNCNVSESVLDDIVIIDNVVNDRGDDTELVDNNSEKSDNISAK
ncbi:hypothetical protein Tco_1281323, partial [Tanacetum coccineum]